METATGTAASTGVDQSKIQKITNNSGEDIVVCLPLTSAETEHSNPIISYNKDYVILRTPTGTVIKSGQTDSVTLDRTFIYNGETTYSPNYDLLISGTTWLTPVANISVTQADDPDTSHPDTEVYSFDPVTVTPDSKAALKQASEFYQTIAAYPDSLLTKNYLAAMNNVHTNVQSKADGSKGSGDAVQTAAVGGVAEFFKNSVNYKLVTIFDIIFVEGYYNRFPFVWAHYVDSIAYYLYSSDGKTTSFQGKLVMSKSGVIDITKPNGGYTCQFLPAVTPTDTTKTDVDSSKSQTLTYTDGVFVNDTGSDVPGIALKGSFQLKRTFSRDPNDTKIITIICGSINGQTAVGFDEAQVTNPDNTTQDWLNSLFHPKTAEGIFNSVMTILGALMMLHFVCSLLSGMISWVRGVVGAGEPVTKEGLQAEEAATKAELEARIKANFKKISGDKASLPETPEDALDVASAEKGTLSDLVSKANAEAGCDDILDNLDTMMDYTDDVPEAMQELNDISDAVSELSDKLTNADIADLKSMLAEVKPKLQELTASMEKLSMKFEEVVTAQEKANMKENIENVQEQAKNEEETEENEVEEGSSENPGEDLEFLEDL